jgi:hypothetical protein
VSVFKGRVTSVVDDVCWGRRRLYSAEVDDHISQNIRDNITKSYSKNVPEVSPKYGKERYKNKFKVQTRILLSDEMLNLGAYSEILHRGTE